VVEPLLGSSASFVRDCGRRGDGGAEETGECATLGFVDERAIPARL